VHFSNEQALMERSGYPAFEQHLKLHEDFAAHVAEFLSNGDDWNEERVQDLRRFLNKWLVGHIMTHDMRFGKWYAGYCNRIVAEVHATRAQPAPVEAPRAQRGIFSMLFGSR
jgi:hemerythrin